MNKQKKVAVTIIATFLAIIVGFYAFRVFGVGTITEIKIEGTLTAPSGDKPFGGARVGSYTLDVRGGHSVVINVTFDQTPAAGMVLEGWLVDLGTGYKLSLGQLDGTKLQFSQTVVNPFTYNLLVITSEPVNDKDPNPAKPVGGDELPSGFGQ